MVCAEFAQLVFFVFGRGEGEDFAAPFVEELYGQVTEPAHPNHPDAVGRSHTALHDRIENSDAPAKKRAGFGRIDSVRDRHGPRPMGPHALGKAARAADNRVLAVRAEVLVAAQAVRATHAAAGEPTKPDAVADFDFFHLFACGDDATCNFMARDQGELGVAPAVVDD